MTTQPGSCSLAAMAAVLSYTGTSQTLPHVSARLTEDTHSQGRQDDRKGQQRAHEQPVSVRAEARRWVYVEHVEVQP